MVIQMLFLSEYYMFYIYLNSMLALERESSSSVCILLFHECTGNAQWLTIL